jgi:predicted Zn-dependent protease
MHLFRLPLPARLIASVCALVILSSPLQAAAAASLIRDAELEQTLRIYTDPLLISADIAPRTVRIFIVNDPAINAFVAGGMNIFVTTGLILATSKPGMLVGVLAHEVGHISGAHLSQFNEKTDRATLGSVLGAVLGAALVAGGAGDAGVGVIAGSQTMSLRRFLSDVRGNEEEADQAALEYLKANDISASGLLTMFELLRRKQSALEKNADPYLQTHPLNTNRVSVVRNALAVSDVPIDSVPVAYKKRHDRMLARLRAFIWTPEQTLTQYPEEDDSVPAQYARAIAYFRLNDMQKSIDILKGMIFTHRDDPFLYDTMGQVYYESGYPKAAALQYKQALRRLPDSPLILTELGRSLIVTGEKAYLREAVKHLDKATQIDDGYTDTWRLLATAYGKLGENGMAYVALAQEAALKGRTKDAIAFADNALQSLPEVSAGAQLARDIKTAAERHLLRQKEGRLF